MNDLIKSKDIELVALKDIKLNPNNRNKHPAEQIDRLVKIIEYQGFRTPVTISNQSGNLAAGEGRYLAAKKMKMTHIPAIFQDFDNEDQELAYGISDNAVSSWSELDISGINAFDIPNLGPDFDIDLLGIKNFNLDISEKFEMEDELKDDMNNKFLLEVTFPNDMEMMDIHDDLVSRGYIVRIK